MLNFLSFLVPKPNLYKLGLLYTLFYSNRYVKINLDHYLSKVTTYASIEYLISFSKCSEGYLKYISSAVYVELL